MLWNGFNLERWFERFFQNVKDVPSVVVTEGMAPYLRPTILGPTTQLLIDATEFFAAPARNEAFLREQGVDVIFVSTRGLVGANGTLGDDPQLEGLPFLNEVFSSDRATVYRVAGGGADGLPTAKGRPGYGC